MTSAADPSDRLSHLVAEALRERDWSVAHLAVESGLKQEQVHPILDSSLPVGLDVVSRVAAALDLHSYLAPPTEVPLSTLNLDIAGGKRLSGEIDVRTSKNAAVATLVAALLNRGTTTLRNLARIEEVNRILEVLNSLGVETRWVKGTNDLVIRRPETLRLEDINGDAARMTRTILLFLGPLMHEFSHFELPFPGGCDLGKRTVEPHVSALKRFGLTVNVTHGDYVADVDSTVQPARPIVLIERGDMLTENVLLAAAGRPATTVIRNASPNYMVQDLCFFLQELGVEIEGIGTTTLTVHGATDIRRDVEYSPSEDPIEAMSLLAAAIVTRSDLTIRRVPLEFMELELAILEEMGLQFDTTPEYTSANGRTRLVDIHVHPSDLVAPKDKIHPMPFPGLNIDNLPFFSVIAAMATGRTLIHDWLYENRAIYLSELTHIGVKVQLMDPHRVMIEGPTRWRAADLVCPPALRPGAVILIGMLAAPEGTRSTLRNIYVIQRGYEDLPARLNALGADIKVSYGP